MKYLLLSIFLALTSCVIVDEPECRSDYDCWSPADACIYGECTFVGAPSGSTVVGCNCSLTTDWPGDVYENDYCYSGYEIVVECNADCCNQYICYPAWGVICL